MYLLIKDCTLSDLKYVIQWARIGANNCMVGNSIERDAMEILDDEAALITGEKKAELFECETCKHYEDCKKKTEGGHCEDYVASFLYLKGFSDGIYCYKNQIIKLGEELRNERDKSKTP